MIHLVLPGCGPANCVDNLVVSGRHRISMCSTSLSGVVAPILGALLPVAARSELHRSGPIIATVPYFELGWRRSLEARYVRRSLRHGRGHRAERRNLLPLRVEDCIGMYCCADSGDLLDNARPECCPNHRALRSGHPHERGKRLSDSGSQRATDGRTGSCGMCDQERLYRFSELPHGV